MSVYIYINMLICVCSYIDIFWHTLLILKILFSYSLHACITKYVYIHICIYICKYIYMIHVYFYVCIIIQLYISISVEIHPKGSDPRYL